jgi:Caspase domain
MAHIVKCNRTRPRTCVLAIGVGEYPHLEGGSGERAKETYGLRQLTSPPVSAGRFTEWLLQHFSNRDAPLGTIDILTSPPVSIQDGTSSCQSTPATTEDVRKAFTAWFKECDSHQDNIAWLYFCGHGVRKSQELALLLRDFGRDANPWNDAIDFSEMWLRMQSVPKARTQLFFIDACQDTPAEIVRRGRLGGIVPIPSSALPASARNAVALYASEPGTRATGPEDQVSHFTSVLLNALGGRASEELADRWVVQAHTIGSSVCHLAATSPGYTGGRSPYILSEIKQPDVTVLEYDAKPSLDPMNPGQTKPGIEASTWQQPAAAPAVAPLVAPSWIYCYACPEDRKWLRGILLMLRTSLREKSSIFTADEILQDKGIHIIPPGVHEEPMKDEALARSGVGFIILSLDILNPVYDHERERLLRAERERGLTLLWVKSTECPHEALGFTTKPIYPVPLDTLSKSKRTQAYLQIAVEIQRCSDRGGMRLV